MAKYRHRGKVVEAIFGYVRGEVSGRLKGRRAAVVDEAGRLRLWDADKFDREYERVEEAVKAGLGDPSWFCPRCGKGTRRLHQAPSGPHVCPECYCKEVKKPKPPTLADLKPGDVYTLVRGGGEYQMLRVGRREIFSQALGYSYEDHASHKVHVLRHHPITPKQQLWIDATPEERKALEDSIRDKWLPRVKGEKATSTCALCVLHGRYGGSIAQCCGCILNRAGERCEADDSPWRRWKRASGWADDDSWGVGTHEQYTATRNMALSLAEFLPPIDPLRIEVEATPEEWPGKEKSC